MQTQLRTPHISTLGRSIAGRRTLLIAALPFPLSDVLRRRKMTENNLSNPFIVFFDITLVSKTLK
jgi:hypothetical protein